MPCVHVLRTKGSSAMLTCECHVPGMPLNHVSACMHAAGQLRDAVGVCANELADPQLAIFLCRLLEPAGGPLLQHLLADELLPRVSISSSTITKNAHIHECRSRTVLQELIKTEIMSCGRDAPVSMVDMQQMHQEVLYEIFQGL